MRTLWTLVLVLLTAGSAQAVPMFTVVEAGFVNATFGNVVNYSITNASTAGEVPLAIVIEVLADGTGLPNVQLGDTDPSAATIAAIAGGTNWVGNPIQDATQWVAPGLVPQSGQNGYTWQHLLTDGAGPLLDYPFLGPSVGFALDFAIEQPPGTPLGPGTQVDLKPPPAHRLVFDLSNANDVVNAGETLNIFNSFNTLPASQFYIAYATSPGAGPVSPDDIGVVTGQVQAIPEPAASALAIVSAAAALALRRRRARSAR